MEQVGRWSASERRSVLGRRQSFCQEAVGLNSESSPDLRWPRVSRSTIVQLPRACDPPHTRLSTDAHMKLILSRIDYCNSVLYDALSEAPGSPEQRGAYRSGSASTLSSTFVLAQGVLPLHHPWLWHCRRRCRTMVTLLDGKCMCVYVVCNKNACAFEMYVLIFEFYT